MPFSEIKSRTEQAAVDLRKFTETAESAWRSRNLSANARGGCQNGSEQQVSRTSKWERYRGKQRFRKRGNGKAKDKLNSAVSTGREKQWANTPEMVERAKREHRCFICGGSDHSSWECSQKEKVSQAGAQITFAISRQKRKAEDGNALVSTPKKQKDIAKALKSITDSLKSLQNSKTITTSTTAATTAANAATATANAATAAAAPGGQG